MSNDPVEELEYAVVQAVLTGCSADRFRAAKTALKTAMTDAERYRWLRRQDADDNSIAAVRAPRGWAVAGADVLCGDRLDEAIDKEMEDGD